MRCFGAHLSFERIALPGPYLICMTSFFSFPRASLAAILAALAALFPLPSHAGPDITTPSPDGRWTIIARRTPVNEGGYLYELRDNTTNKTFLKQTTFQ